MVVRGNGYAQRSHSYCLWRVSTLSHTYMSRRMWLLNCIFQAQAVSESKERLEL